MTRTALTLIALLFLPVAARAASPTIESVFPAAGQRGAEFTLILTGARLTGPEELLFYEPGVVCTRLAATSPSEAKATLRAAPDCRLGTYAFRLRTRGGVSEVRTFRITPFPVVAEKEPNDTPRQAQQVPLNVSIAGNMESGGVDCFAVRLKKGQRLAAEVEAVRLGGELTDAVLTVFGPDGRELGMVDDTPLFRQDPLLTLLAPTDGIYTVQVRETNNNGSDTSRYLLHIGDFVRPSAVFPPGGQAGAEVKVKLLGDAAGERTQTVKLPESADGFAFYATDGKTTAPTPNPFRVSPFPNVIETEPNDDPSQANPSPHGWPVAFNGVIDRPGDVDHFRFRAAKGDVIDVQAFAARIGSPLDTIVAVLDPSGAVLAANDDDETHDSRLRVTIAADGEYVVRITDKKKGGGPAFVYRLELSRPISGLTVFLAAPQRKSQDRQAISIPRGNRVLAYLGVRRDGFSGPVKLDLGQLPAGVKVTFGTIPADDYLVPVLFEAAPDAPLGGRLIEVNGVGGDAPNVVRGGFRQEANLTPGPGDSSFHAVRLSRLAVVVAEETPLSVAVVPPSCPFAVDGKLDLTVKVMRAKDFGASVEISFPCLPPGVEAPTAVAVPPEKDEAVVTLIAHPSAEVGDWRLAIEAKPGATARGRRDPLVAGAGNTLQNRRRVAEGMLPVASQLLDVKVAAPPLKGRFLPLVAEQGKTVKVTCQLDFAAPLSEALTATLDGLPPRATAKKVELKPGAKRVEFTIVVDATTPPGEYRSLVCELAGKVEGQNVVYRVGRGGVLEVHPPGAVKSDASGKALSPLDALRRNERKEGMKKP
ncbi:MAG TPA: PPC domain-containing protein [Gemmataceae bacterium]|nr:PPC domain-containing protein [Gemmataceae bacterium]